MQGSADWKNGIVCVLDVLGVKNLSRRLTNEFLGKIDEVRMAFDKIEGVFQRRLNVSMDFVQPKYMTFGDTLLWLWPLKAGLSERKKLDILRVVAALVSSGIAVCLENNLPMRGAFALGDFIHDEERAVGPAIADAATWYEAQDQIGVVVTPKTSIVLEYLAEACGADFSNGTLHSTFIKTPIRLNKGHKMNLWSLAWPLSFCIHENFYRGKDNRFAREEFLRVLDKNNITPGSESKYINSLDYFDEVTRTFSATLPDIIENKLDDRKNLDRLVRSYCTPKRMYA